MISTKSFFGKINCKFILGSTFVVIGRPQSLPVNEESACNPTSIYGVNRLASEYYCKIFYELYGIDTIVFRITNWWKTNKYKWIKKFFHFL